MAEDTDLFPKELKKKRNKCIIIYMNKLISLILVLFLINTVAFSAEKKQVPYSKNQVELNLNGDQNFIEKIKQPVSGSEAETDLNTPVALKKVVSARKIKTTDTSSEVEMTIKPFKDKRVDFDVGSDQSFPDKNRPAQSGVNSSIRFRL